MRAGLLVLENATSLTSNKAEESQVKSDESWGSTKRRLDVNELLGQDECMVYSLCSGHTSSKGDKEKSRSLIYPESCVLDELNESLRAMSCPELSLGRGARWYASSFMATDSIAQTRLLILKMQSKRRF